VEAIANEPVVFASDAIIIGEHLIEETVRLVVVEKQGGVSLFRQNESRSDAKRPDSIRDETGFHRRPNPVGSKSQIRFPIVMKPVTAFIARRAAAIHRTTSRLPGQR